MGKGGPQPAYQVRPGDLQVELASADVEDPESDQVDFFGNKELPVPQLMRNEAVLLAEDEQEEVVLNQDEGSKDGQSTKVDDEGSKDGQSTKVDDEGSKDGQSTKVDDEGSKDGQSTKVDDEESVKNEKFDSPQYYLSWPLDENNSNRKWPKVVTGKLRLINPEASEWYQSTHATAPEDPYLIIRRRNRNDLIGIREKPNTKHQLTSRSYKNRYFDLAQAQKPRTKYDHPEMNRSHNNKNIHLVHEREVETDSELPDRSQPKEDFSPVNKMPNPPAAPRRRLHRGRRQPHNPRRDEATDRCAGQSLVDIQAGNGDFQVDRKDMGDVVGDEVMGHIAMVSEDEVIGHIAVVSEVTNQPTQAAHSPHRSKNQVQPRTGPPEDQDPTTAEDFLSCLVSSPCACPSDHCSLASLGEEENDRSQVTAAADHLEETKEHELDLQPQEVDTMHQEIPEALKCPVKLGKHLMRVQSAGQQGSWFGSQSKQELYTDVLNNYDCSAMALNNECPVKFLNRHDCLTEILTTPNSVVDGQGKKISEKVESRSETVCEVAGQEENVVKCEKMQSGHAGNPAPRADQVEASSNRARQDKAVSRQDDLPEGVGSPLKGVGSPLKGVGSPLKGVGSPLKGVDGLHKGLDNLSDNVDYLPQDIGSLIEVVNQKPCLTSIELEDVDKVPTTVDGEEISVGTLKFKKGTSHDFKSDFNIKAGSRKLGGAENTDSDSLSAGAQSKERVSLITLDAGHGQIMLTSDFGVDTESHVRLKRPHNQQHPGKTSNTSLDVSKNSRQISESGKSSFKNVGVGMESVMPHKIPRLSVQLDYHLKSGDALTSQTESMCSRSGINRPRKKCQPKVCKVDGQNNNILVEARARDRPGGSLRLPWKLGLDTDEHEVLLGVGGQSDASLIVSGVTCPSITSDIVPNNCQNALESPNVSLTERYSNLKNLSRQTLKSKVAIDVWQGTEDRLHLCSAWNDGKGLNTLPTQTGNVEDAASATKIECASSKERNLHPTETKWCSSHQPFFKKFGENTRVFAVPKKRLVPRRNKRTAPTKVGKKVPKRQKGNRVSFVKRKGFVRRVKHERVVSKEKCCTTDKKIYQRELMGFRDCRSSPSSQSEVTRLPDIHESYRRHNVCVTHVSRDAGLSWRMSGQGIRPVNCGFTSQVGVQQHDRLQAESKATGRAQGQGYTGRIARFGPRVQYYTALSPERASVNCQTSVVNVKSTSVQCKSPSCRGSQRSNLSAGCLGSGLQSAGSFHKKNLDMHDVASRVNRWSSASLKSQGLHQTDSGSLSPRVVFDPDSSFQATNIDITSSFFLSSSLPSELVNYEMQNVQTTGFPQNKHGLCARLDNVTCSREKYARHNRGRRFRQASSKISSIPATLYRNTTQDPDRMNKFSKIKPDTSTSVSSINSLGYHRSPRSTKLMTYISSAKYAKLNSTSNFLDKERNEDKSYFESVGGLATVTRGQSESIALASTTIATITNEVTITVPGHRHSQITNYSSKSNRDKHRFIPLKKTMMRSRDLSTGSDVDGNPRAKLDSLSVPERTSRFPVAADATEYDYTTSNAYENTDSENKHILYQSDFTESKPINRSQLKDQELKPSCFAQDKHTMSSSVDEFALSMSNTTAPLNWRHFHKPDPQVETSSEMTKAPTETLDTSLISRQYKEPQMDLYTSPVLRNNRTAFSNLHSSAELNDREVGIPWEAPRALSVCTKFTDHDKCDEDKYSLAITDLGIWSRLQQAEYYQSSFAVPNEKKLQTNSKAQGHQPVRHTLEDTHVTQGIEPRASLNQVDTFLRHDTDQRKPSLKLLNPRNALSRAPRPSPGNQLHARKDHEGRKGKELSQNHEKKVKGNRPNNHARKISVNRPDNPTRIERGDWPDWNMKTEDRGQPLTHEISKPQNGPYDHLRREGAEQTGDHSKRQLPYIQKVPGRRGEARDQVNARQISQQLPRLHSTNKSGTQLPDILPARSALRDERPDGRRPRPQPGVPEGLSGWMGARTRESATRERKFWESKNNCNCPTTEGLRVGSERTARCSSVRRPSRTPGKLSDRALHQQQREPGKLSDRALHQRQREPGKLSDRALHQQQREPGQLSDRALHQQQREPGKLSDRALHQQQREPGQYLVAESHYQPSTNVIQVLVKPVNLAVSRSQLNVKVKVYHTPPVDLPPISPQKRPNKRLTNNNSSSKKVGRRNLSRDIIEQRAANPPFNTSTNPEAETRFLRMFSNKQIL